MARRDSHLKMTGDDLRAARILTLAVKFFGARNSVLSSTIRAELYPDLDEASFSRQFLRDRELLATFGIVIREAKRDDGETAWLVDEEASYVHGSELGSRDARMLYVLCHDMAFDQAFPYRDELRIALAKISRMYRGATVFHADATTPTEHKMLAVLVSCMSNRHATAITYTDARGVRSERTIAILGSFGLRDQTYFVASRIEGTDRLVPDSVRTYRLDRFDKARELSRITYHIPLDFSVADYERLPFQMGEPLGDARFCVGDDVDKEVTRATATHGVVQDCEQGHVWEVSYSNTSALASWAVGGGLTPLAPEDLRDAWREVLEKTISADLHQASLGSDTNVGKTAKTKKRAGRTGSIATARQLVALATSLTNEGEVITADDIATTLGVSYDDARHLIALVSMGSGESFDYLPVILSDEDDEVSLMEGAALGGRRVRLTRAETIALSSALAELGVDQDDPLVKTLANSYAAPSFSIEDIARSIEEPSSATDSETLKLCSRAIAEGSGLTFSYLPVTGGVASTRRVIPEALRRSDDSWYLDAFDLVRLGRRVFRIDRMSEVVQVEEHMPPRPQDREPHEQRLVCMHFDDPSYLDLFHWDGMRIISHDVTGTTALVPHYGGSWLARHLAACAGTVKVSDETLAEQAKDYARQQLA